MKFFTIFLVFFSGVGVVSAADWQVTIRLGEGYPSDGRYSSYDGYRYEEPYGYVPRENQRERPVMVVPAYRAYQYESSQESARPQRRY